jgi:hypothetical protein
VFPDLRRLDNPFNNTYNTLQFRKALLREFKGLFRWLCLWRDVLHHSYYNAENSGAGIGVDVLKGVQANVARILGTPSSRQLAEQIGELKCIID